MPLCLFVQGINIPKGSEYIYYNKSKNEKNHDAWNGHTDFLATIIELLHFLNCSYPLKVNQSCKVWKRQELSVTDGPLKIKEKLRFQKPLPDPKRSLIEKSSEIIWYKQPYIHREFHAIQFFVTL